MNNKTPSSYLIFEFDSIDSTQDDLKRRLSTLDFEPNAVVAVVAFEQTKGRGRQGRKWFSPANENIYLSVGIPLPEAILSSPELLCPLTSLAVYEYIASFGIESVKIKWPNDILVNGKKIAGILIETMTVTQRQSPDADTSFQLYALIGIGVNLNMSAEECKMIVDRPITSVLSETGERSTIRDEARNLIQTILQHIKDDPDFISSLFQKWLHKISWLKGEEITTHRKDGNLQKGIVEDITPQGLLVIRNSQTGEREIISSGL